MKRAIVTLLVFALPAVVILGGCGGGEERSAVPDVPYAEVQSVFDRNGCVACHPSVNDSLDLTPAASYDSLVGVQALEDPRLYRVVAGDPERSFLYLKIGGAPPLFDIPAIGTRMPPQSPPIPAADMETIRNWILGGAKDENGETRGPEVETPGSPPTGLSDAEVAAETTGTGVITGSVIGQDRRPVAGAFVTLLLTGEQHEGGEEHYRVAQTDAEGNFTLDRAPAGRFLLKAYAPSSIYVSRIVALEEGETEEIEFGLPNRVIPNPVISQPRVEGRKLSMNVRGSNLDGNYTLAVNPEAGVTVELHNDGNEPGRWSAVAPKELPGDWVFLAVDKTCNVSEFITVER
ncbi:MAG: carboxypeptidase-like regulatory domain-containing protein [Gaiella sp.]